MAKGNNSRTTEAKNSKGSVTVEDALNEAINGGDAGSPTSIPLQEESAQDSETEVSAGPSEVTEEPKTVTRLLGCVVCPVNGRLDESDLALAWKEFNNSDAETRKINLKAQAIDQHTNQYMGETVQITVIPNDLTHGLVLGRTIGFSGFLVGETQTPNHEGGCLCPQDPEGWENGPIWVSISYDLYDQVGRIEGYKKGKTEYSLAKVGVSTALNLAANQVG